MLWRGGNLQLSKVLTALKRFFLLSESKNLLKTNSVLQKFNNKIVIITGELSGEMHAVHLVESFKKRFSFEFSAMGSTGLSLAGIDVIYDYRDISLTGISEIFSKLHHIRRAFKTIKEHIRSTKPALIILVDFPGFNLKIARFAKKLNIPVLYFIPPQIWAWKKNRIFTIKKYVDQVISVLPFEKTLYETFGINVVYVGHPFTQTVKPSLSREAFLNKVGINRREPIITIMPGSRENEIIKHMPVLLKTIDVIRKSMPQINVILPLADNIDDSALEPFKEKLGNTIVIRNHAYNALSYCDAAIVASGSVTLEAAILGTPTIVIYQISPLSYLIAKMLVKVNWISLPNIIAEKEVFPEFIQNLDAAKIAEKTLYMVHNGKEEIKRDIENIITKLGRHNSYESARDTIIAFLENRYGALS
ncbi:MAG: lipid-A-disaccharide synthase [Syntrophus sp. (in: bacteria)]|nr:lipid-A-disaccharide synthase [Syntrophus sp. (in: bacteria)]